MTKADRLLSSRYCRTGTEEHHGGETVLVGGEASGVHQGPKEHILMFESS